MGSFRISKPKTVRNGTISLLMSQNAKIGFEYELPDKKCERCGDFVSGKLRYCRECRKQTVSDFLKNQKFTISKDRLHEGVKITTSIGHKFTLNYRRLLYVHDKTTTTNE